MDFRIDSLTGYTPGTLPARNPIEQAENQTFANEMAVLHMDSTETDGDTSGSGMPPDLYMYMLGAAASSSSLPVAALEAGSAVPPESTTSDISAGTSLAAVNNNPGNLRFANQHGATLGSGGFARFPTMDDGYQALVHQVNLDAGRGYTLAQYITKYAPPSENDTQTYIQQASQALGIAPDTPLAETDPARVAVFQAQKESGTIIR